MTPESTITVTIHKTYKFDVSQIHNLLIDEGYEDVEIDEALVKEKAEEKAADLFVNEVFCSNKPNDFISTKTTINNQ